MKRIKKALACSFCGKDERQVPRLIAGPRAVFICDVCVGLCNAILAENPPPVTGVGHEAGARRIGQPWWRRVLDRWHASLARAPLPRVSYPIR